MPRDLPVYIIPGHHGLLIVRERVARRSRPLVARYDLPAQHQLLLLRQDLAGLNIDERHARPAGGIDHAAIAGRHGVRADLGMAGETAHRIDPAADPATPLEDQCLQPLFFEKPRRAQPERPAPITITSTRSLLPGEFGKIEAVALLAIPAATAPMIASRLDKITTAVPRLVMIVLVFADGFRRLPCTGYWDWVAPGGKACFSKSPLCEHSNRRQRLRSIRTPVKREFPLLAAAGVAILARPEGPLLHRVGGGRDHDRKSTKAPGTFSQCLLPPSVLGCRPRPRLWPNRLTSPTRRSGCGPLCRCAALWMTDW